MSVNSVQEEIALHLQVAITCRLADLFFFFFLVEGGETIVDNLAFFLHHCENLSCFLIWLEWFTPLWTISKGHLCWTFGRKKIRSIKETSDVKCQVEKKTCHSRVKTGLLLKMCKLYRLQVHRVALECRKEQLSKCSAPIKVLSRRQESQTSVFCWIPVGRKSPYSKFS